MLCWQQKDCIKVHTVIKQTSLITFGLLRWHGVVGTPTPWKIPGTKENPITSNSVLMASNQ